MTVRPLICPLDVAAEAVPQGARALDVGCGAGLFLQWLAHERGLASGTGVDLSPEAIAAASGCVAPNVPLRFEWHGSEDPWPTGLFDAVTLVDVLHHVPREEQRAFIGRLRQTGARLAIVKDVDPRPRWKRWMNALHDFLMTRRGVYPRAMAEVRAWLEEDGFRVTRAERVDRLWYSHYLIVAERGREWAAR
jgi:cyclopropane fatty-acyl-phospholipid synthase-like methyltransferase